METKCDVSLQRFGLTYVRSGQYCHAFVYNVCVQMCKSVYEDIRVGMAQVANETVTDKQLCLHGWESETFKPTRAPCCYLSCSGFPFA